MKAILNIDGKEYSASLDDGVDISIGIGGIKKVSAYGIPHAKISTYIDGDFVGDVSKGGSCNVRGISLSPHGNGTHTECVGHVSNPYITLDNVLKNYFFAANLITVNAKNAIGLEHLSLLEKLPKTEALIIRTLPNDVFKLEMNYTHAGAIFIHSSAMEYLVNLGIKHLVVDIPSVDSETDPNLLSHKIFWAIKKDLKSPRTITELVYIPNNINDGLYLMNLMVPNIFLDAVPSKPILYPLR